jgi:hypothetical protein
MVPLAVKPVAGAAAEEGAASSDLLQPVKTARAQTAVISGVFMGQAFMILARHRAVKLESCSARGGPVRSNAVAIQLGVATFWQRKKPAKSGDFQQC